MASTTRPAASLATADSSARTTTSVPATLTTRTSTRDEADGADQGRLENAVHTGSLQRFGDERRLVEWLELPSPARDLGAVPVRGGQQVIGLPGDARTDQRARPLCLDVDPHQ